MTDPITTADIARLHELLRVASNFSSQSMRTAALGVLCKEAANAIPVLLDQLDAQAAEIERWRSDWKRIAADEAVWYTLSDIFGVEGMTNAAGVVSGVTEKWNERQTRVAELEGRLREATSLLRDLLEVEGAESYGEYRASIMAVLAKRSAE